MKSTVQALALVLACALLAAAPASAQTYTLTTTGAPTIAPLISNFIFSFRSVNPTVALNFGGTSTTTNLAARQATYGATGVSAVDFGMSNEQYTAAEVVCARFVAVAAQQLCVCCCDGQNVFLLLNCLLCLLHCRSQTAAAANGFSGGLMSIPFTSTPLVISYNLPTAAVVTGGYLTLDLPTVYKIFTNAVKTWGDSAIVVRIIWS